MQRKPLIAGNWKMHKTIPESVDLAAEIVRRLSDISDREIVVAPPFPCLSEVKRKLSGSQISLCAQNIHHEGQGAFTGEVSALMILSAGCTHVILGHSERRQMFGETDRLVNLKLLSAVQKGLTPIVCVGETLDERESGTYFDVVSSQVQSGLKGLTKEDSARIIVAYEPVWAIGTGRNASPEQAREMHASIRCAVTGLFGGAVADGMRVLYGGSVKPDNISSLMAQPGIDGALVGGASLKADDFERIAKF